MRQGQVRYKVTGETPEMLLRDHDLTLPEAVLAVPLSKKDLAKTNAIAASEGLDAETYVGKMLHELLESKRAA